MSTNSGLEIQPFVEQQHGGPMHPAGTHVVVMSLDVFREIMGVGTDDELPAAVTTPTCSERGAMMDSPFPGMDPHLEQHWRSVHQRLVVYAGDQLQAALPRPFRVDVEERVFVAGDADGPRTIWPDVHVVERHAPRSSPPGGGATLLADPVVLEVLDEPVTEIYLEIVDAASGNRVITAIEFLSPSNKLPGDGHELYVRKQQEYRAGGVNQVEIDLTRQGNRSTVFPLARLSSRYRSLYLAWARRSWQPAKIEVYPLPLQQPLPTIGIPLDPTHPDVPLDLQSLVTQCYRNGRYDDIDYRRLPEPPLPPDDAVWAAELLQRRNALGDPRPPDEEK